LLYNSVNPIRVNDGEMPVNNEAVEQTPPDDEIKTSYYHAHITACTVVHACMHSVKNDLLSECKLPTLAPCTKKTPKPIITKLCQIDYVATFYRCAEQ